MNTSQSNPKSRLTSIGWAFLVGLISLIGLYFILFYIAKAHDEEARAIIDKANTFAGICYETKASAIGLSTSGSDTQMQLIFPSGVREVYSVSDLKKVPYPATMDAKRD